MFQGRATCESLGHVVAAGSFILGGVTDASCDATGGGPLQPKEGVMLRPIFMAILVSVMVLGGVLPAHTDDRDKDDDGNKTGHRAILNAVNGGTSSSNTAHTTLRSEHAAQNTAQDAAHSALTQQLTDIQAAIASLSTGGSAQPPCGAGTEARRFVVSPDGTEVCDNTTGLNWQQNPDSTQRTQANALAYCPTVAARSRVPEVKELISVLDYASFHPPLPTSHPFTNIHSDNYWSATTFAGDSTQAWGVLLSTGIVRPSGKGVAFFVWCVRGA